MREQEFEAKVEAEAVEEEEVEEGAEASPVKEKPKFNEEEHLRKWDEDNPAIHVPDEIIDDIDNDIDIDFYGEVEQS